MLTENFALSLLACQCALLVGCFILDILGI